MKTIILLTFLNTAASISSQSVLTLDAGTSMGVLPGTDLCVNIINGPGILYGSGSICGGLVSVEPIAENQFPETFDISQNYPNPFNPITVIYYRIPEISYVSIKIYDQLGRLVYDLFGSEQNAGSYRLTFDGTELASGIYYYMIKAGDFIKTKKMNLIK